MPNSERGYFGATRTSVLGTRVHAQLGVRPDVSDLRSWCENALKFVDRVAIAADLEMYEDVKREVQPLGTHVEALLVSPWHGFTPALNAIVGDAKRIDADKLILMSREVIADPEPILALKPWIGTNVLVVGARLAHDHGPRRGTQKITAYNSPWNTLAVWNVHLLGLNGFPGISDGDRRDIPAGMEEVITISLFQHLYGDRARAFLVEAPGNTWRQCSGDSLRDAAHQRKMDTKETRANAQLERMGIDRGEVVVVPYSRAQIMMAPTIRPTPLPPDELAPPSSRSRAR